MARFLNCCSSAFAPEQQKLIAVECNGVRAGCVTQECVVL